MTNPEKPPVCDYLAAAAAASQANLQLMKVNGLMDKKL